MMKQAAKMQEQMAQAQAELADKQVTATAGGGKVTVVANGAGDVLSIKISKDVVDPEDVEMLEDLVLTGVKKAIEEGKALAQSEMGKLRRAWACAGMGFRSPNGTREGCARSHVQPTGLITSAPSVVRVASRVGAHQQPHRCAGRLHIHQHQHFRRRPNGWHQRCDGRVFAGPLAGRIQRPLCTLALLSSASRRLPLRSARDARPLA